MRTQPDLLLIMTDQQRFDQVGYASGGHFETPNIDLLASRGVVFENAYSASTTCVPARVALLTGLQPHRVPTQINAHALREGFWTVARALRSAGYETALIGKMHFAPVHAEHGFDTMRLCEHLHGQGLGSLQSTVHRDRFDDYHDWLLDQGLEDWRFPSRTSDSGQAKPTRRFPYAAAIHPTGWIESEVLSFLEHRNRTRPLFLVVSFPHPHAPYNPPEPYASMFDPAESVLPALGFEVNEELPDVFTSAMTQFGKWKVPRVDHDNELPLRRFLATVRGLVRHIDDATGRVLANFDPADTVVFFTSDHGDFAGHRGLLRKNPWLPFDDLARVPLVVAAGDAREGARSELVQSSDLALTCLDYAGVPAPPEIDFDSRSLRALVTGEPDPHSLDRAVFCATSMGWPMVRRGRFKYLEHRRSRTGVLFDLALDPDERIDLRHDPNYAREVDELSALLDAELRRGSVDLPTLREV